MNAQESVQGMPQIQMQRRPTQAYEISIGHFAEFLRLVHREEHLRIIVEYGELANPPYVQVNDGQLIFSYSLSATLLEYIRMCETDLKTDDTLVLRDDRIDRPPLQT